MDYNIVENLKKNYFRFFFIKSYHTFLNLI